jgi:hypothetical protein
MRTRQEALRQRFEHSKAREYSMQGFQLENEQMNREWDNLVQIAAKPKQALSDIHVFALVSRFV